MSVKVSNITKSYSSQLALNDVSFTIDQGEVVGFLGPNGAGKSTMMKIATGSIKADSGNVEICNFDVEKNPEKIRRLVGYLPEQNPLYPDMFVREYLTMVADFYNINNLSSRVCEMIETTGLEAESHKKIGALSKGYRQRVGIAQALLPDPQVIILDEPTTGLDPNQLVEIRGLIKRVGHQRTVLLSTHIMQEVEAMCDRVIIIDHGVIKASGRVDEIASGITKKMTVDVEFDKTVDANLLVSLFNEENVQRVSDVEFLISGTDPRREIFNFAVKNNLVILKMSPSKNSLEDIFHSITNN